MDHLLPLLFRLLGVGARAIDVSAGGVEPAEDPEGGDEGERDEAEQRGGLQRNGHGGPAAEPAEVGAHLAPRHLPVALPRQVHQLRRRQPSPRPSSTGVHLTRPLPNSPSGSSTPPAPQSSASPLHPHRGWGFEDSGRFLRLRTR